jgi:hypothetical protein
MKKLLFIGGTTLLLLSMLLGTFFVSPLLVSAHNTRGVGGAPTSNPYCQIYIQYVARHLNISVATLLQAKLAADEDVLAQLVKEGKLTQAQADKTRATLPARLASNPCY